MAGAGISSGSRRSFREEYRIPEFPTKFPEDVNETVIVSHKEYHVYRVTETIEEGSLKLPTSYSYLGQLFWSIEVDDLLKKFSKKFYKPLGEHRENRFGKGPEFPILAGYLIKFKTLLAGYRLRNSREFYQAFQTAQTEEEFCALAGVS